MKALLFLVIIFLAGCINNYKYQESKIGSWSNDDKNEFELVMSNTTELDRYKDKKNEFIKCYFEKCENKFSSFAEANQNPEECGKLVFSCIVELKLFDMSSDINSKKTIGTKPKLKIVLPKDFVIEKTEDEKSILSAFKYKSGVVSRSFSIVYNDDWSFSTFTSDEFISENLKDSHRKKLLSMLNIEYEDPQINLLEEVYFSSLGRCLYSVFSGIARGTDARVTSIQIQTIKNNTLFTFRYQLIGTGLFRDSNQEFFKSIETVEFKN